LRPSGRLTECHAEAEANAPRAVPGRISALRRACESQYRVSGEPSRGTLTFFAGLATASAVPAFVPVRTNTTQGQTMDRSLTDPSRVTRILLPSSGTWGHGVGPGSRGVQLHYVRQGRGNPVLLLHGWPGFWYDWRRVIPGLALLADVIAPDLRGFGDSDKPDLPPSSGYTPEVHADDLAHLIEHLALAPVVVVAHDIGATIAQTLARRFPHHVRALVLLNPPYPGIGTRRFEPQAQREFWYQHFHQLPLAEELVGHSRGTIGAYLRYFYRHWTGRQDMLSEDELDSIVDVYARPGAFAASLAYYRARAGAKDARAATIPIEKIGQPTSVLWGESDPVIPVSWSDRLGDTFTDVTLRTLPGIGHFVPWEAPHDVIEAVSRVLDPGATASNADR